MRDFIYERIPYVMKKRTSVLNLIFNVVVRAVIFLPTTLPMFIIVNSATIAVATTRQKYSNFSMSTASLFWGIAKE